MVGIKARMICNDFQSKLKNSSVLRFLKLKFTALVLVTIDYKLRFIENRKKFYNDKN